MVSAGNGLPTVCLKGSDNDRDQLITASARRHARLPRGSSHTVTGGPMCTAALHTQCQNNSRAPQMDVLHAKALSRTEKPLCYMLKKTARGNMNSMLDQECLVV